jgi:hypothetical protein
MSQKAIIFILAAVRTLNLITNQKVNEGRSSVQAQAVVSC